MNAVFDIHDANPVELKQFGMLLVNVYSSLPDFPTPQQQPAYYQMLANIASFADKPSTRVLVCLNKDKELVGGLVYFGDMSQYGSGGTATTIPNASGIRLLAVDPKFRGSGAGKALTLTCIELARQQGHSQVLLHTTKAMQQAWSMYEKLGFCRYNELDFLQQELAVYGFRLQLN